MYNFEISFDEHGAEMHQWAKKTQEEITRSK